MDTFALHCFFPSFRSRKVLAKIGTGSRGKDYGHNAEYATAATILS